jgi:hypothetical protein
VTAVAYYRALAAILNSMKIVLLGSIPKGDDVRKGRTDWKVTYMEVIKSVAPGVTFIHGDAISDNAGPELVVGHDLAQVKKADMCVVDAKEKIGAGTAQEIVFAKYLKKPVAIVIPKDTHHRKTNITFHGVTIEDWIHPFLFLSTDYVADSIEDAADWIKNYIDSPSRYPIKDMAVFEEAIKHFETARIADSAWTH